MARAAVLVPCQSDCAEVLPEDVSADEVLQGPLLSAKLNDCRSLHWSAASSNFQVNEIATAAVGFMIHGDVLMTQNTGTGSDLLSEVQASLKQLSAFNMTAHADSSHAGLQRRQPASSAAHASSPAVTDTASMLPQHQMQSALRHRRHAMGTEQAPSSTVVCVPLSQVEETPSDFGLFHAPDLPGLKQAKAATEQAAQSPCLIDIWGSMQSELLGNVLRQMQWTSREAIALTGVCHSWRRVITSDQHFLKGIAVSVNPKAPLRGNQPLCECCRGMSVMVQQARHRQLPLPRVVDKAAHAGNLSACVCVAQILDTRGDTSAALKLWSKAGKLGHPEAQFRLGRACYEGVGVAADAQDALLWLGRATKTLLAEDINVESISNVSTASLLARRSQLHLDRRQGFPCNRRVNFQTDSSMPEEQVLAKAALLLGFLHLDGEATKFDAAEALKWFKVALLNDCAEAERIIGTLFNTGQYG
ncbi:TPA: hypothetical protein ACH3X3_005602 [Trebouxia sp. C0006]